PSRLKGERTPAVLMLKDEKQITYNGYKSCRDLKAVISCLFVITKKDLALHLFYRSVEVRNKCPSAFFCFCNFLYLCGKF
ncbi:MAG: hypothetical protein LBL94_07215, partial [Prevotellaceae bacterium]|nr:hypothetical protein [Prevotellaceae bacterium]